MADMVVRGIPVNIIRKNIKNLHLGVYPPDGRVRVAVPLNVSDDAVRIAIIDKLSWIKRKQGEFQQQQRETEREFVTGESHFFLGKRYLLNVVYLDSKPNVSVRGKYLDLFVRPGSGVSQREKVIKEWYREHLKAMIPSLIEKWEERIGVKASAWGVKQMKTKWGSCNTESGRVWFNLELARKSPQCLEYIVVHELMHLIERHHNDRFVKLMDQHLPHWRLLRDELNSGMLSHQDWTY